MKITSGKVPGPQRIVIYGPEGIGKSLFAAAFPSPLFLDIEGSTQEYDVARAPKPTSWAALLATIAELQRDPLNYQTFVVDTADWAERLGIDQIKGQYGLSALGGQDDFGHSYNLLAEQWGKLLDSLSELANAGLNVVLTAHAKMRKFEQPEEFGAYDRWEMKLEKKTAALTKEWATSVLFLNYKTLIIKDEKTKSAKGQGSQRCIFTEHHACWDAKNRLALPAEILMQMEDYPTIVAQICPPRAVPAPTPATVSAPGSSPSPAPQSTESAPKRQLKELMAQSGTNWDQLLDLCVKKGHLAAGTKFNNAPDDIIVRMFIPNWEKISGMLEGNAANV